MTPSRILSLAAGALLLAACSTTTMPDTRQTVAEVCLGYADALQTLAGARARGELSAAEDQSVEAARTLAGPICEHQADGSVRVDAETVERLRDPIKTVVTTAAAH